MPWYLYHALKQLFPSGRFFSFFSFMSIVGGMLGVFWAFGVELVRRERAVDSESYREFSTLWSRVRRELRMPGARRG